MVVKDDHETGTIPCGAQATPIQWNVSGPAGPTGPPGPAGATDFTFTGATFYVPVGAPLRKVIGCPAGRRAVAGGFAATADAVRVVASEPEETAINETPMAGGPPPRTGWAVTFVNTGPNAELATASAVCAAIG